MDNLILHLIFLQKQMAEAMFLLILPFLYQTLSSSTDFLYLLLCTNCLCLWILLYSRVLQAICIIPSLDSLSFVFQSLCTFLLSFVHCTTYFPSSLPQKWWIVQWLASGQRVPFLFRKPLSAFRWEYRILFCFMLCLGLPFYSIMLPIKHVLQ